MNNTELPRRCEFCRGEGSKLSPMMLTKIKCMHCEGKGWLKNVAPAAQPASAPVASIDTPEFQRLLEAHRLSSNITRQSHWHGEIRAHIDAWGQQQRREGQRDAHETNVTLLLARDKMRERAEKAEALVARLSDGVTKATKAMYYILPADPADVPENSRELWYLHADLKALLSAESDKPNGCTGTPSCCPDNEGYGCACTPTSGASHA